MLRRKSRKAITQETNVHDGSRILPSGFRHRLLALLAVVPMLLPAAGCSQSTEEYAEDLTGGNADRGKRAIRALGCHTCHTIPGIPGGEAVVGPSLDGIGGRVYIAGILENSPENMTRWILDPRTLDPRTAMPPTGATESEARDIAAYLYTLQ
jgi:cytochrome c